MSRVLALLLAFASCATTPADGAPVATSTYGEGMIQVTRFADEELDRVQRQWDERVASGDRVVTFAINSFGGSVFAGMDFLQHVESSKKRYGVKTVCVVDSRAYSMGFAMLQSGACDVRLMTPRSTLLAHNSSGGSEGTAEELEETAALLRALNEALATMCATRMGIPVDAFRARIAANAWVMAATEAVAVRAVDGLVDPASLPPLYAVKRSAEPVRALMPPKWYMMSRPCSGCGKSGFQCPCMAYEGVWWRLSRGEPPREEEWAWLMEEYAWEEHLHTRKRRQRSIARRNASCMRQIRD